MSVTYFLKIDGVNGDSTSKAFSKWFQVDSFSIGESTPFTAGAGGLPAGRSSFTPLTVDIHSAAGLALLFQDETANKLIKSVELIAVDTTTKGTTQTVYDLKLTDALIGSITNSPGLKGVETALTFHYKERTLTDRPATGPAQTFNFNTSPSDIAGSDAAPSFVATTVPAASPVHYFLKIDGVDGDVTTKTFDKWYAVDGFAIGESTAFTAGAGGLPAGRAAFTPLTVDIHSVAGLALLLKDETTNSLIKSVELVGVESNNKGISQTVYDLKLSNALASSVVTNPGANGVDTELTFHYKQLSLTDRPPSGPAETFTTNTTGITAGAAIVGESTDAVSTGGVASIDATQVPAASPVHYFLKIDGVNGDVTTKAFDKWYAVDGFAIGESTPFLAGAGGQASGRASFTPLTVDIHSAAGLALLLKDETTNNLIKSVELVGVENSNKGISQTIYDLKLSNALLSSIATDPGAKGVESELTFHYKQLSLTDRPPTGPAETFSTNTSGVTAGGAIVGQSTDAVSSGGLASIDATQVPASSPVTYFLKINGVNGDVTTKAFAKWYAVDGFDIGESTPFLAGAGGLPTGRASFTPLTVDIHSAAGLALLFQDETTNSLIKSVELVGVENNNKGISQTVYDLKLSNALLSSIANDPGAKGVESELTFHYRQLALTDTPPGGQAQTFTTNTGGGTAGAAIAGESTDAVSTGGVASIDATQVPASSPVNYFLKIDGVNGDVTAKRFAKWYAVDGFDIGESTPFSSNSADGLPAGRASFTPLTVDIHSVAGLALLLTDETTNNLIKSVELVGVENSTKGGSQTVYDLKLSNALLSSIANDPGAKGVESELTFHYKQLTVTDPQNTFTTNTGVTSGAAIAGESTDAVSTGGVASIDVPQVPASSPLQYFLKIDGVNGDVTAKGFAKWYAVDGFDIGEATAFLSVGEQIEGPAQFSPLTVDIHGGSGLASLFTDETSNTSIKSVELVAVGANNKGQSQKVYDLTLSHAELSGITNSPGASSVESQLTFHYNQVTLVDTPTGGPQQTFNFNLNQVT